MDGMENKQQHIKEDVTNMLTIMRELVRDRDKEPLVGDTTRTVDTREKSRRLRRRKDDSSSGPGLRDRRPRDKEESYDGDDEESGGIHDSESSTGKRTSEIEMMSRRPRGGWRFRPRSQRPNFTSMTKDLEREDRNVNIEKVINELRQELDMLKCAKEDDGASDLIEPLDKPLADNVRMANPPKKFKMLNLDRYKGATYPVAHVENFREQMILQGLTDEYMCRVFPLTLEGPAREWFKCLPRSSIDTFSILAKELINQFQGAKPPSRDPTTLQYIKQLESENLKAYVTKYHEQVMHLGVFNA